MNDFPLLASHAAGSAVRADFRSLALIEEIDRYLAELIDEVGEPTTEEWSRAGDIARRIDRT